MGNGVQFATTLLMMAVRIFKKVMMIYCGHIFSHNRLPLSCTCELSNPQRLRGAATVRSFSRKSMGMYCAALWVHSYAFLLLLTFSFILITVKNLARNISNWWKPAHWIGNNKPCVTKCSAADSVMRRFGRYWRPCYASLWAKSFDFWALFIISRSADWDTTIGLRGWPPHCRLNPLILWSPFNDVILLSVDQGRMTQARNCVTGSVLAWRQGCIHRNGLKLLEAFPSAIIC